MKYNVGDRIKIIGIEDDLEDVVGRVVRVTVVDTNTRPPLVGVDFGEDVGGHDLWYEGRSHCEYDNGWWFTEKNIKKADMNLENK